jgi:hypothetical protein
MAQCSAPHSLKGDYTATDKPGMGPSPFPVVLDQLAPATQPAALTAC